MKKPYLSLFIFTLLIAASPLFAAQETVQSARVEPARTASQAMLAEAENARAEAESARIEATRASQLARELAQKHAEEARENQGRAHEKREELTRLQEAQREEMARAREELGRAHRELRQASRELAQAHRDLSRSGHDVEIIREINLGDRAVIGVVLGNQTGQGVEIIGVSPDGPAERAGLEPGDLLVSIAGENLADSGQSRRSVFQVIREVEDGEVVPVVVHRDDQVIEFMVTAEQREPMGWQSLIEIPEPPGVPESPHAPQAPQAPQVVAETFEISAMDEVALAAEIAELSERVEATAHRFVIHDGENVYEWATDDFSDFGNLAMEEANIWFGLPQAHGLELTSINEGLGAYFDTDRGVLVIQAREGNAYELQPGDVILSIDAIEVRSPSDLMRALREFVPGDGIDIEIKRNRKDKTLNVTVPENRLGLR